MKCMLMIYGEEQALLAATTTDSSGMNPDYAAYNAALINAGAMLGGERLRPSSTATGVRVRNGKSEVVDGPYAETREQFGGYYMIEAPDLDQAIAWASKCPGAEHGTVEVRPIWPTRGE